MNIEKTFINLSEKGWVPEFLIRAAIRQLCKKRLEQCKVHDCEANAEFLEEFLQTVDSSNLAIETEKANEQHYEVPSGFYELVLGGNLKYSCCYFDKGTSDLTHAEDQALELTCRRAGLENGLEILELGCGWGSLTLRMASLYPESRITAVSNSNSQREFILAKAEDKGIENLEVITADVNAFNPSETFDRIVSVEMFEHVRNHRDLFSRMEGWLKADGKLFTHVFCHRSTSYAFEVQGEDDWMSKHFFSGGTMPSDEHFIRISGDLNLEKRWRWAGTHYARTADEWLKNTREQKKEILSLFEKEMDAEEASRNYHRWRIFFMACSETFAFENGQEWWVSHYLFSKK